MFPNSLFSTQPLHLFLFSAPAGKTTESIRWSSSSFLFQLNRCRTLGKMGRIHTAPSSLERQCRNVEGRCLSGFLFSRVEGREFEVSVRSSRCRSDLWSLARLYQSVRYLKAKGKFCCEQDERMRVLAVVNVAKLKARASRVKS